MLFCLFSSATICIYNFYLYKSQIRPTMEYYCCIWPGSAQSSLSNLDSIQKRLYGLVGDELFSSLQSLSLRQNVTSSLLLQHYFYDKGSNELHSLAATILTFTENNCYVPWDKLYSSPSYSIRRKFHLNSYLRNKLPRGCFLNHNNLNPFKSMINSYLSHIPS